MSIFSSIGSFLGNVGSSIASGVSTAYHAAQNLWSSGAGPQSQTASANNANVFGSPAYNAQNVARGLQPASGPGSAYYAPTTGGAFGSSPLLNYGPQLPVSISSGKTNTSSSGATNSIANYSAPSQPVTISSNTLGGGISSPSGVSGGGTSPIVLPSAPGSTNPSLNPTGLAGVLSGYKKYNAATGQWEDVPDPTQSSTIDQATKKKIDDTTAYIKGVIGQNPDSAYNDPNVVAARQQRDQIRQSLQAPTDELNAVVAKQNQDLLQLRQTGSQEGVTEAVYGGQSAAINYNAAIRSLPLQGQIASIQGNLKLAQDYLNEEFQMKSDQIKSQNEYNSTILSAILPVLTTEDKRAYDQLQTKNTQDTKNAQDLLDTQKTLLTSANAQNAPQPIKDAIRSATSIPNAINAAGQYAGNMIDQQIKTAQLSKLNAEIKGLSPVAITNPNATQYSTALNTILGSSKFTKEQKATVINAVNNGEDPFTVIKNQAKNIMGQTEATNVTKLEVARDTLADIGTQLTQFYAAGGKTSLISGNFEKVVNKLGAVNDPKLVNLATQIQGNLQIYRNAISGTAYSAQEGKDISSIFPGINKSQSLNQAILSARNTLFDSVIDSSYRSALGKTYDDLKKAAVQDVSKSETVTIQTPDGRTGTIPKANLDAALKAGAKQI